MKILVAVTTILLTMFGCPALPVREDPPPTAPGSTKDVDGMSAVHFPTGADPTDREQLWVCAWLDLEDHGSPEFSCVQWSAFVEAMRDRKGAGSDSATEL